MTAAAPPEDPAANVRPHVFVSYARADEKQVRPLVQAIEAAGYAVWWDELIQGGAAFSGSIAAALGSAFAVVVMWSATAVESHWVRDEAQIGAERGCLVPVSLDGALPPLGFRQFHTIDLGKGRERGRAQLIEALAALAARGPVAIPPPRPARRSLAMPSRRTLLIGGGATVVVGGVLAQPAVRRLLGMDAREQSVAVLPFDNLSGDPDKAYFAEGVATEIRAQLTRIPRLQVAAQTSSVAAAHDNQDARSTASKLDVAYLLDGNVRRDGDRLRIWTELVDGRSGFSAWSQTFDRPATDLFAIQAEIAGSVSSAIGSRLFAAADAKPQVIEPGGTSNLAAFDAYLRGLHLYDAAAGEDTDRGALAEFERAIGLDPGYALAHAARGRTLAIIGNQYAQGETRRNSYRAAIQAAQKAVDLAPDSAATQSALGFTLFDGQLDARAADSHYEQSQRLGAGDSDVVSRYGLFATRMGRFPQARTAQDRARALDPLNPRVLWRRAEVELADRQYGPAVALATEALKLNPRMSVAHSLIGTAQVLTGDIAGAEAWFAAEPSSLFSLPGLAIVRHRQGRSAEAQQAVARMVAEHGDNCLYQQAQVYAQWGDGARCEQMLASAKTSGDAGLTLLRNDALLDPVRRTATYVRLLKEIGFA